MAVTLYIPSWTSEQTESKILAFVRNAMLHDPGFNGVTVNIDRSEVSCCWIDDPNEVLNGYADVALHRAAQNLLESDSE